MRNFGPDPNNKHRLINSSSFANQAATWETTQEGIQVSYDVINFYPSIPIDKAITVLIETLINDLDDLNTRTKLTLTDIHKLTELCLSKSYFLYESKIRLLENAGPIGLSLMVVLSESYLQHLEHKAIAEALTIQIQPKTFKRYVDDSHARFTSKYHAKTFQEILNKQDPAIQYTIEYENGNNSLNFLDINITNTINNKYQFKVNRKKAITNIRIKPTLCIDPNIIKSVFKGFLHRAHSICSEKYIKEEEKLLPNSQPGVYQLDCSCNGKYIGESKKRVLTRCIEHQQDSISGKWESFGATEHTKEFHGQFDWLHPKTVRISLYMYEKKIRETLEITSKKTINEKDKTFTVLNRDNGD